MGHVLTEVGPCKKRADIDLEAGEVQKGFNEAYQEICETINVPGFRKGKVPRQLVAKKFGKDIVQEVKQKLISKTFQEMIEGEKLEVISQPRVDEKGHEFQEGNDFSFSVSFEIKPEFELPEYKKIPLTKTVREVTDEHMEDATKNLLRSYAKVEDSEDGELEGDDVAMLQLEAVDEDGEVVHQNHLFPCTLNSTELDIFPVKDIGKKLTGMKKGDTKEISHKVNKKFPAKEELSDKKLKLKIEIVKVRKVVIPEMNDEFLKNLGFETEEAFKERMKEMLESQFENQAKSLLKEQIYEFLAENTEMSLPEETVNRHKDYLVQMKVYELMRSGVSREDAEARKEEFEEEALEQARREVKVGFILGKISDKEKVFVTEREVAQRIVGVAMQQGKAPEKLREELEENDEMGALRSQLKEEKTLDLLIKKADISEKQVAAEDDADDDSDEKKAKKKSTKKKSAKKED